MAKKAVTEVESKIKKLLADRKTEMTDLKERVEEAKQQQTSAIEAMEKATVAGDVKAYRQAKADRTDAGDAIEMHTKRLNALENQPLVSKGEYEKGVAQIMAAMGEVSAEAKKQIISHMEQIRVIAAETNAEIAKGNEVLHQWQHKIYKDDATITRQNGSKGHLNHLEKQFRDYSVSQFADFVLSSGYYQTITGKCR